VFLNEDVKNYQYDVALSFAGENREYVEDVAVFLKSRGLSIFYDKFEQADLWGKNLYDYLQDVYKNRAKYTIIFLSEYYKQKAWTNHERQAAQARAFEESKEYILPVKFDDTEIPGLNSTVGYLDAQQFKPKEVAILFLEKCGFNTRNRWWGNWERSAIPMSLTGNLCITSVDDKGIYFDLLVANGAHIGNLESGFAKFMSQNKAIFEDKDHYSDKVCRIHFYKFNDYIQITETDCSSHHGMRAYFDGDYYLNKDIFWHFDEVVDDQALSKIYLILGKEHWLNFIKCFNDTYEDIDSELNAKVISGGMAGFYTIYEAIVLIGENSKIWGAFLDVDKLFYFTSEKEDTIKLPKSIEKWADKFKEKKIVYINH
jgi:hypothetical protein